MKVAEIVVNGTDSSGAPILTVYSRVDPDYAVYRTEDRVMVHFADDKGLATAQSATLAALNPVRGEINGMIDGWRASGAPDKKAKTGLFDRRVADALVMALLGDPANADALLQLIRRDLIEERTSWARFEYLLVASATAALLILLFGLVTMNWFRSVYAFSPDVRTLWRAAGVGTIGAFFSIAIAIRGRTVLTDLQSRDNAADAVLRIVIGAIAAALLICLLQSGVATVLIGGRSISPGEEQSWLLVIVVAFLAGFSERLVPDLLEKSALSAAAARTTAGAAAASPALTRRAADAARGGERAASAKAQADDQSAETGAATDTDVPDEHVEEDNDGCVADIDLQPAEVTDDAELPPASGGVASVG